MAGAAQDGLGGKAQRLPANRTIASNTTKTNTTTAATTATTSTTTSTLNEGKAAKAKAEAMQKQKQMQGQKQQQRRKSEIKNNPKKNNDLALAICFFTWMTTPREHLVNSNNIAASLEIRLITLSAFAITIRKEWF